MTSDGGPAQQVLVIIPTYNERENIEEIIERTTATVPIAHVLVVDDGSPDGTGQDRGQARVQRRPGTRPAPRAKRPVSGRRT